MKTNNLKYKITINKEFCHSSLKKKKYYYRNVKNRN